MGLKAGEGWEWVNEFCATLTSTALVTPPEGIGESDSGGQASWVRQRIGAGRLRRRAASRDRPFQRSWVPRRAKLWPALRRGGGLGLQ